MYPKEERDYHKRKENNMIGFPECGNCESTPCQCERDDNNWFISSTDNKPKSTLDLLREFVKDELSNLSKRQVERLNYIINRK